jgi:hypothetical protein
MRIRANKNSSKIRRAHRHRFITTPLRP